MTEVEVFRAKDGWRWRAVARNGEVIAQSEGYTRRYSAARGGERAFPDAQLFYIEEDQ